MPRRFLQLLALNDGGTNTASIFSNEAKVGFDSTTTAFSHSVISTMVLTVATEASNITDSASLTSFLGNFNVLDSQSFSDATAAGFSLLEIPMFPSKELAMTHISCHLAE